MKIGFEFLIAKEADLRSWFPILFGLIKIGYFKQVGDPRIGQEFLQTFLQITR